MFCIFLFMKHCNIVLNHFSYILYCVLLTFVILGGYQNSINNGEN